MEGTHTDTWLVGNDVRKAVADGFPVENVVATDIHPGERRCGQSLA